mgnify:FL=1
MKATTQRPARPRAADPQEMLRTQFFGWMSAPRLLKKLVEAGMTTEEAQRGMAELAQARWQHHRLHAWVRLVAGGLLMLPPLQHLLGDLQAGEFQLHLGYGLAVAGFILIDILQGTISA